MKPGAGQLELVASERAFLESPRWHEGRLYVSDFHTHEVLVLADGRLERVCEVFQQPSGLGWDKDGNLLVVSMLDRRLLRLQNSALVEVADLSDLAGGPCNDLLVDAEGRSYVGSFYPEIDSDGPLQPTRIVSIDPDGTARVAADGLICPNGMALTADGRTLLVAETLRGRVTAFDRDSDGSLANRGPWAAFPTSRRTRIPSEIVASDLILPDGVCLDAEGALWVADAGGSGVVRIAAGGEILERIHVDDLAVFACTLGGNDGRVLFLCAAPPLFTTDYKTDHRSCLLSLRVDVPSPHQ